jgi:hypothetical protein
VTSDWSPKQLEDFFASRKAEGDEEHFADRFFLKPAQEGGDWDLLAYYLLDMNGPPTLAMRAFLAAVLRGDAPRKKHAPKKVATPARQLIIGGFVERLKQKGAHDPILQAQTFFKVSRASVQAAKRKFETCEPANRDFVRRGGQSLALHYRGRK